MDGEGARARHLPTKGPGGHGVAWPLRKHRTAGATGFLAHSRPSLTEVIGGGRTDWPWLAERQLAPERRSDGGWTGTRFIVRTVENPMALTAAQQLDSEEIALGMFVEH
jgi:hypothetical protein